MVGKEEEEEGEEGEKEVVENSIVKSDPHGGGELLILSFSSFWFLSIFSKSSFALP